MGKQYSPIKICNPQSENHLVPLYPNQSFCLRISSWYGIVDIDWASKFFDMSSETQRQDGSLEITFKQNYDLSSWSAVSNLFLGEVVVIGDYTASLCVFLKTTNPYKNGVITALNPLRQELKMDVYQVLEVVVSDAELGPDDQWEYGIESSKDNIEFEQIAYEVIDSIAKKHSVNVDDVYCPFPRNLERQSREHHFWFRIDEKSVSVVSVMRDGTYAGGKITFEGHSKDGSKKSFQRVLNIQVSVRSKHKNRYWAALLLPRKSNDLFNVLCGIPFLSAQPRHPRIRRLPWWEQHMEQEIVLKKKTSRICG